MSKTLVLTVVLDTVLLLPKWNTFEKLDVFKELCIFLSNSNFNTFLQFSQWWLKMIVQDHCIIFFNFLQSVHTFKEYLFKTVTSKISPVIAAYFSPSSHHFSHFFNFSSYFCFSSLSHNQNCWQFNSREKRLSHFSVTDAPMSHSDESWHSADFAAKWQEVQLRATGNRKQPRMSFTSHLPLVMRGHGKSSEDEVREEKWMQKGKGKKKA